MNDFGTSVDLRSETIRDIFFTQARDLTERNNRMSSIDLQFSDALI